MSCHEEFRELLREGKNREALLLALANSLELKIKTISKKAQLRWETRINLLKGITNIINRTEALTNLTKPEEIQLTQFHECQRKQAYEIWQKNRETLIKVFQIMTGRDTENIEIETESHEGEEEEKQAWIDSITDNILGEETEEEEKLLAKGEKITHHNGVCRDSSIPASQLQGELEAEEEEMMIEAAAALELAMASAGEEEEKEKGEVKMEIGEEWEEWLKEDEDEDSSCQQLEGINWSEEDWSEGEEGEGEEGEIGSNSKS